MNKLIGTLVVCLGVAFSAFGETPALAPEGNFTAASPALQSYLAPAAPKPSAPDRDKWLRLGLVWGSTAFDLASTKYALAANPNTREGNPLVSGKNGSLQTGRYLALLLPLNAAATYATLKYPNSKTVRVLTYVTSAVKIGIGVNNFSHSR